MSCLTANIVRDPQKLTMSAVRQGPTLTFRVALVCGSSLGTTAVLYASDGILLTIDGEKIIVQR